MKLDKISWIGIAAAVLFLVAFIVYGNINKSKVAAGEKIKGSNLTLAPVTKVEKITIKTDEKGRVSLGAE